MATEEKKPAGSNLSANPELANGFDAKQLIKKHAAAKTVIKYKDRKKVVITKDTRHYHEGQIINPHKIMADELIAQGIAKGVKA